MGHHSGSLLISTVIQYGMYYGMGCVESPSASSNVLPALHLSAPFLTLVSFLSHYYYYTCTEFLLLHIEHYRYSFDTH